MAGKIVVNLPSSKGHKQLYIVTAAGKRYSMGNTPPQLTTEVGSKFGTAERQGTTDVNRAAGRKLRTLSFTHIVVSGDWASSIEKHVAPYLRLAEAGGKVKLSGGSALAEGGRWWNITGLSVTYVQRAKNNEVSRAELAWSFEEYSGGSITISSGSKPTAKSVAKGKAKSSKPKGGKPATRTYTVRQGDTLTKIAKTQLGNAMRYKEILKLNPKSKIPNPNNIKAGLKILLPKK